MPRSIGRTGRLRRSKSSNSERSFLIRKAIFLYTMMVGEVAQQYVRDRMT